MIDADNVRSHVEPLLSSAICGTSPDRETSIWLASITPKLKIKLAKQGLVTGVVARESYLLVFEEKWLEATGKSDAYSDAYSDALTANQA